MNSNFFQPVSIESKTSLSAVLLRRGYLIDTEHLTIYLTDNSYFRRNWYEAVYNTPAHSTDQVHLAALLKRLDLGSIKPSRLPNRLYSLTQDDKLLSTEEISSIFSGDDVETGHAYSLHEESFTYFLKHPYGYKVPLAALDPHVAFLVKAFSAVGCYTWRSCGGRTELDAEHMRLLQVNFACEASTAWAIHLFKQAQAHGIALSGLHIDAEKLALLEVTTGTFGSQRNLARAQSEAIDFGLFIYENRMRIRAERLSWASNFKPSPKSNQPARGLGPPLSIRIRLSDRNGYAIEFTVDGFKSLREKSTKIIKTWSEINPANRPFRVHSIDRIDALKERLSRIRSQLAFYRQLSKSEAEKPDHPFRKEYRPRIDTLVNAELVIRAHIAYTQTPAVEIQVARMDDPLPWYTPWGDSKPVRIRPSLRNDQGVQTNHLHFYIRRTGKSKNEATTDSWLLLWMGIREALPGRGL